MKNILSLVLTLLLSCMPALAAQEVDKDKMSKDHQKAYDAALALYGTSGNVTHFLCSTTVVAERPSDEVKGQHEYLLLTAGHCVTGGGLPEDLTFGVNEQIVEENSHPVLQSVEVVRAQNDDKYDFAVLFLRSSKVYPKIELDVTYEPSIEDKVYNVNFSLGLIKQVSVGEVASKVFENKTAAGDCTPCVGRFMVHLFDGPGSSGSAIINEKTHKIIGIVELGFPSQTVGVAAETMSSFLKWIESPITTASPKDQRLQSKRGK
jgi:Trypsin-like peptidase domain